MPELSQQNARSSLETENLFTTPKTAENFFSIENQMVKSTVLKDLFALFQEKNIKKTQLNQLNKMEEMNAASKKNNLNVLDIHLARLRLRTVFENNEQRIEAQFKTILANNQYKSELRRLVSRNIQLLDAQKQLGEAFSEELINEEQVQKYKALINREFDFLCSEPIRELYQRDFQAILDVGISESDLSYLGALSQLDETIRLQTGDKIAEYYMQVAEKQISQNSFVTSTKANALMKKDILNLDGLSNGVRLYEDQTMPAIYTADTVEQINELVLNGADPVKESQCLESTPLAQHLVLRYVLQQELYGVGSRQLSIKAQFKFKYAKQILDQQFSKEQGELETNLKNEIERLKVEAERQPELKMDLENHIQALNNEAKQQIFKLKSDLVNQTKILKKKIESLTPELKRELRNQLKSLKAEAGGLELELKNNAALIDAHIKAIVLRDVDAQISNYPDIAGKERFLQTWNNCKQEVKALQQTQLTENCNAYHFLTQDLAKLSAIETKTMKWAMAQFPEYKSLLQMQSDLLDNYRLVQGPLPQASTTEERVVDTSTHSVKVPAVSEIKVSEKQEMPSKEKNSTENKPLIQRLNGSRLVNAAFYNANVQTKFPSMPEKTSEGTSRLNGSLFFAPGNSTSKLVNKDSQVQTWMVSRLMPIERR